MPHQGRLNIGPAADLPDYDAAAENAWVAPRNRKRLPVDLRPPPAETAVAQMLNQHIIGGVRFKKGCYPAKKSSRTRYRGQVKRGLAVLTAATPEAAGIAVQQDHRQKPA